MNKELAINLMKIRFTKIRTIVWADIWYPNKPLPPQRFPIGLTKSQLSSAENSDLTYNYSNDEPESELSEK